MTLTGLQFIIILGTTLFPAYPISMKMSHVSFVGVSFLAWLSSGCQATKPNPAHQTTLSSQSPKEDMPPAAKVDKLPRVVKKINPRVPFEFKKGNDTDDMFEQGQGAPYQKTSQIVLEFVVNTRGEPTEIRAVGRYELSLLYAAVAALEEWRFTPALKDGKPVPYKMRQPFTFSRR